MVLAYTVSREKCLIDRLEGVLDDDEPQMNPRMDRGGREQRFKDFAKPLMKQFRQICKRPNVTCWERVDATSYFIGCLDCALSPLRYRSGCITFYRGVWLCIYQSMSEDNEIELRAHIRHLLLDYALTHLTTDYVVYTQSAVAEVRILVGTHSLGYP